MKRIKLILAILLIVALLIGNVQSAVFASPESDGLALTELEPTIDPRLPELFEQEDKTDEPEHAPDDVVRVSIILDGESAIDKGYPIATIGNDKAAADYQDKLCREQEKVVDRIEDKVLDGEKLDVFTNLTLIANLVSADVEYAQIEEIENVKGVKEVVLENVYEPLQDVQTTDEKVAAIEKAASAYTGAGSRIAIIDSGVNDAHQSFDVDALNYSLKQSAPDPDQNHTVDEKELADYKTSLDFMTKSDVVEAINDNRLHVLPQHLNAKKLYLNEKIPFAYNYSDFSHFTQNGAAGIHGSHVSGIAAANAYIPVDEGAEKTFVKAEEAGAMVGTAPDAQILNLKVFGSALCTDAVIAMALEDALILGADVLNLSLGTAEVGFSCANSIFSDVFQKLTSQGVLIMGAVGNDGSWVSENTKGRPNKLYADDVNVSLCTPPSSYADLMGVAWADDPALPTTMNKSSAYGIPSSLMLQPEITAYGTQVNSVDGNSNNGYTKLSGTSMASPDVAGAAAVAAQYLRTKQFGGDSFLSRAQTHNGDLNQGMIIGGLLMSTADPMFDSEGNYYSLLRQGAGLLNTKRVTEAKSFLEIAGQSRGRVKAEVGDCPSGSNTFRYQFTLHNVSDEDRSYILETNLFTEDIVTEGDVNFLADKTRTLAGAATYAVGGKELDIVSERSADINGDQKTDAADAQALLDFLSGKTDGSELDLDVADVDGDGKKTTYDAHLILKGLTTSVTVGANSSVTVDVALRVIEDLSEDYPKGAYLEGFTSVIPADSDEADADVTHTIPIIGFCGNWSDPSMFDRNNFVESFSGQNDTIPYTQVPQNVYEINYMTYQDEGGNLLKQAVNLYDSKSSIPLDKLALSPNDTIRSVQLTLIRPAGAMCFAIMTRDESGARHVKHIDAVYLHQTCAFPAPNTINGWSRASVSLPVRATLKKMLKNTGVKEGDTIELGAVAVPEYYEETSGKTLNADRIKKLIEDGTLGEGAYLTTTVTLDGKAPTVDKVEPDGGTLRVTVKDEQSVAFVGLYSASGAYSLAKHIPNGADATPEALVEFNASALREGGSYNIVVGDYAGNRSMYRFTLGSEQTLSGKVIAGVRSGSNRGDWIAVDPGTFSNGNEIVFSHNASAVLAGADAADGYLWQAFEDGSLRVAPLDDASATRFICDLAAAGMETVRDLAFSSLDKKLYATDGSATLWQIDPMRGDVKQMPPITVNDKPAALYGLAINSAGEATATHYDETTKKSVLVSWKIDESADAAVQTCPTGHNELSTMRYISLTWANSSRTDLYAACAENLGSASPKNYLYRISSINFENKTAVAYKPNSGWDGNMSLYYQAVRGLVNLAVMPNLNLVQDDKSAPPAALRLLGTKDEMVAGDTLQLTAAISPWNAQSAAASVKWQAEGAASVDENGTVTATEAGKATVTATLETDGAPLTASCEIEVKPAPDINVTAMFCEGNGAYYWENFGTARPNERKRLASSNAYTAGTLNRSGNCLYLFSGSWAYRVDPQTFRAEPLDAAIDASHKHADAAPGLSKGIRTSFGYFTVEPNGQTLLLGSRLDSAHSTMVDCFDTVTVSLHTGRVNVGAMAGIAYKGVVQTKDLSDYRESDKNPACKDETYDADLYYVINESGDLFELYCYEAPRWYYDENLHQPGEWAETEIVYEKRLGHVDGVSLPGVSEMTNYATSSMIYDAKSDKLVLVGKTGIGAARVQVIDPRTASLVMSREFDDDVRQVGVLYQYDYSGHSGLASAAASTANAVQTHAENSDVQVSETEKAVTYRLTGDRTTNGLTTIAYHPDVLTFRDLSTAMPYHAYNVDEEKGVIQIAFANAAEIENPSAQITFAFEPQKAEQTTTLTVTELERGNPEGYDSTQREEPVSLPAKSVEKIEVRKGPDKTEYIEGQPFDPAGLTVYAVYTDGTEEPLMQGEYTVTPPDDFSALGTHMVTVRYQDFTAQFEVTVKAKTLKNITVSKEPNKMKYVEETPFDDSGMVLTLHYDNGDEETVVKGWDVSYDFSKTGRRDVVIRYKGLETVLQVDVVAKTLVSVSVEKQPDQMRYIEGTLFNDSGMTLRLHYNNDTSEVVDSGWEIGAYNFEKTGKCDVVIRYKGLETVLQVDVVAKTLVSVSVEKQPDQMRYIEGTLFNDSGMTLRLHYNNDTSEVVDSGWEIGAYNFEKTGKCDVVIRYKEQETVLQVDVVAKSVIGIEIVTPPNKRTYPQNSKTLDTRGGKLVVYYDNDTTEEMAFSDRMLFNGFDGTKSGKQTITVTYAGKSATFTVTVTADATKQFKDVPKGSWFVGAVNFAVTNGLFEGMDETHFAPNGNMTRAMYVTVLGRLAGAKVNHKTATKFSDVPTGQWYTGYVKWASDNGIVEGDNGKFSPNANVTREQICKMMIEYCSFAGIKLKSVNKAMTFKDADQISGWAKKYVSKAQTAGFVNGDNGYFDPKGNATRAQVATIFMNFQNNYDVL